jgi:PhnB protein
MAAWFLPEEHVMGAKLDPYLSFDGDARQALEFYQAVFGGELSLNTFGQYGMAGDGADKIMHGSLNGDYILMASDTPPGMEFNPGSNVSMCLSGDSEDVLRGFWEKLIDGGTVSVPLEKQMWGDIFGSCVDKFGIYWMVNIAG